MSDGYNAYIFLDGDLERTDHLICMAHDKVKFSRACEHGEDMVAKEFEDMISELYDLEDGYKLRCLISYDITVKHQGEDIESIVQKKL